MKTTILTNTLAAQNKSTFLSISCPQIYSLTQQCGAPFEGLRWATVEEVKRADKMTYATREHFIRCECKYDIQELNILGEKLRDLDTNKKNYTNYGQERLEIENHYTEIAKRYPEFKSAPKQKTSDTIRTFHVIKEQKQAVDAGVKQSLKAMRESANSLNLLGLITSLGSFIEHKIKLRSVEEKFKKAEKNYHVLERNHPQAPVRETLVFFKQANHISPKDSSLSPAPVYPFLKH